MPNSCPSEERFPLLLLFLEDGQRSTKHNKRILIDKSRYQGITSGATAVLTQWPGHLTTCWLTATLVGLTIILLSMMLFALSLHPGIHLLSARCRSNQAYDKSNESATIHLVHGHRPWVQSQLDTLEQIAQNYPQSKIDLMIIQTEINFKKQSQASATILNGSKSDKDGTVDGQELNPTTSADLKGTSQTIVPSADLGASKTTTLKNLKRIKRIKRFLKPKGISPINKIYFYPWDKYQLNINIGQKKLLNMLIRSRDVKQQLKKRQLKTKPTQATKTAKIKSIEDLIKIYPKIQVTNTTFEKVFQMSPLHFQWQRLNEVTRLFAVRVLQMWNTAGIAFDLPEFPQTSDVTTPATNEGDMYKYTVIDKSLAPQLNENVKKFKKLITIGLSSFENLPQGLVTVDDEGLHMETKTTCHAFFGEVLMNLKDASRETMPTDIIRQTLKTFCKRGAVDTDYCRKINS